MSCIIGQEKANFNLILEDNNNAFLNVDFTIEDKELNDANNTDTYNEQDKDFVHSKEFRSSGSKKIKAITHFDDGWGNEYLHTVEIEKVVQVYDAPILNLSWTPEEPTILDEVNFEQKHNDLRDDTVPSKYGSIDKISIDYYNDGSDDNNRDEEPDEVDLNKNDTFKHTFDKKQDGIQIKVVARYWDGFEYQTTEKIEILNMSNIPPESNYTRDDQGVCIPKYIWTATSTDLDDNDADLTYHWILYKNSKDDGSGDWSEIDNRDDKQYTYPFQYAGKYKIELVTTDIEGSTDVKTEEFDISFSECSSGGSGSCSGKIIIQPNTTQNIAIPVKGKKVKEYFVDKVAEALGKDASEIFKLIKARPADDKSIGKYLIYIPGVTDPNNSGNFELVRTDGDTDEITAFLCQTYDFEDPFTFEWDSADGE